MHLQATSRQHLGLPFELELSRLYPCHVPINEGWLGLGLGLGLAFGLGFQHVLPWRELWPCDIQLFRR